MRGGRFFGLLFLVIGLGNGQRFFSGIPGGSTQVASRSQGATAPTVGLSSERIDQLLDSAVRSITGERGSARGAPAPRPSPPSAPSRPSPPRDTTEDSVSKVSDRIQSFNRARNNRPSFRSRTGPSSPDIRPIQTPAQQTTRRQQASAQTKSNVNLAGQTETVEAAPTSFSSFVPNRGNDRVFDPSSNPLNQRKRPQIQQFDNLGSSENTDVASFQPLPNDFLPTCPDATFSYIIPSPTQCDLYYLCEFGNPSKKMCEDGLVFSIDQVKCVPATHEDCEDRPLLQAPKGTGPCERKNGIFYTNETCNSFVTCRDNTPSYEGCAEGLVFDPKQKICAWSDEALRPGCLPEDLLGFRCPNPKLSQEQALLARVHLRFGDHDRHADPKDCRYFFMCLVTGQPRRAGCGRGKVFDPSAGICKLAKDVPECADYYGVAVPPSGRTGQVLETRGSQTDARILRIQDDISRQFSRSSQLLTRNKRYLMEEASPED